MFDPGSLLVSKIALIVGISEFILKGEELTSKMSKFFEGPVEFSLVRGNFCGDFIKSIGDIVEPSVEGINFALDVNFFELKFWDEFVFELIDFIL